LFVVLLIVAATLTGVLFNAPPEERPKMIAWAKNYFFKTIDQTVTQITSEIENVAPAELLQGVRSGEAFQQIASCGKTKTSALEKSTSAEIYRWTDESGQVHFSDAKPGATRNTDVMTVNYQDRKQYFNLKLVEDSQNLPAFTRDKVSAEVRQVYRILSGDLQLEHLRKVFLNVRIIGTQASFQEYKAQVAPQIRTNSGFYTSQNNEAVVFQGNNSATMRAVIRHEATHVIMAGLYGVTPSWFNEGLAEYFEQLEISGQSRQVDAVDYHWAHLQNRHQQGDLMPLQEYVNLPPQQWYNGNLQDNYSLAWSVVFFLMEKPEGKRFLKGMMNDMAEDYCWSTPGSEYFDANYPGGFKAFEERWATWLEGEIPKPHRY